MECIKYIYCFDFYTKYVNFAYTKTLKSRCSLIIDKIYV